MFQVLNAIRNAIKFFSRANSYLQCLPICYAAQKKKTFRHFVSCKAKEAFYILQRKKKKRNSLDSAIQSINQPMEHYILHYLRAAKQIFDVCVPLKQQPIQHYVVQ
jgi:hypothetical protein